jgi:hypothetical protein
MPSHWFNRKKYILIFIIVGGKFSLVSQENFEEYLTAAGEG